MSNEITPCVICSTDEEKVMPEIDRLDGMFQYRCCSGCGISADYWMSERRAAKNWNDLQDRLSAKIESVAAEREQAARKAEREKAVKQMEDELLRRYWGGARRVSLADIRAVAEKVKAK